MKLLEEVRGAVARGWCHDNNRTKEMDSDLAAAIADEIMLLLPADFVPVPYPHPSIETDPTRDPVNFPENIR